MTSDVVGLIQKADAVAREGNPKQATDLYLQAWKSIPGQKENFPLSRIILVQIYSQMKKMGNTKEARHYLEKSYTALGGKEDSRINFLLGATYLDEDNDRQKAKFYLRKAFDISEGRALLDEDPRYVELVEEKD